MLSSTCFVKRGGIAGSATKLSACRLRIWREGVLISGTRRVIFRYMPIRVSLQYSRESSECACYGDTYRVIDGMTAWMRSNRERPTGWSLQWTNRIQTIGGQIMAALEPGGKAPAFSLMDQDGKKIKLSDYKGKKLLLYFYPKANTSG